MPIIPIIAARFHPERIGFKCLYKLEKKTSCQSNQTIVASSHLALSIGPENRSVKRDIIPVWFIMGLEARVLKKLSSAARLDQLLI